MLNRVMLIGTITKPATTKKLNNGTAIGTIVINCPQTISGKLTDNYLEISLWGKSLEEANKIGLGATILVEGRIRCRTVKSVKTGGDMMFTSVTADKITSLELPQADEFTKEMNINSELDAFHQKSFEENPF